MKAFLTLANGRVFTGESVGYPASAVGEVVFSTGMTGYVESLTDPSFANQILTFTYPLIGNYGVPELTQLAPQLQASAESDRIWVNGVVMSECCQQPSHHQSKLTFSQWLQQAKIPAVVSIDTRALTQMIRDEGVMVGQLVIGEANQPATTAQFVTETLEPVQRTSITQVIRYQPLGVANGKTLALIDCGMKHGILRQLLQLGYSVIRLPWTVNPLDYKTEIDGVVCSNGPGDPKEWGVTIEHIKQVIQTKMPYVGICLGHQLLALAIGADTYKLPYGHRGLNQPCQDLVTKKAYLTSQNHGYAVRPETLPAEFAPWFVNLNDGTNEGLRAVSQPAWSVQFHPEGQPGPFDSDWIFELLKTATKSGIRE